MSTKPEPLHCPVLEPIASDRILLAHGEGGRLMRRLIHEQIRPAIENEYLRLAGDSAVLPATRGPLAMTTDSFVVSPLFFPGGDIGSLAVYGTVNDLAVAGADPNWGRILAAAGRAGVQFDPGRTTVHVGDVLLFENGLPHDDAAPQAAEYLKGDTIRIEVDLGGGSDFRVHRYRVRGGRARNERGGLPGRPELAGVPRTRVL